MLRNARSVNPTFTLEKSRYRASLDYSKFVLFILQVALGTFAARVHFCKFLARLEPCLLSVGVEPPSGEHR